MIAVLDMKLSFEVNELSYQMASTFHGVLMDLLPEQYATYSPFACKIFICRTIKAFAEILAFSSESRPRQCYYFI